MPIDDLLASLPPEMLDTERPPTPTPEEEQQQQQEEPVGKQATKRKLDSPALHSSKKRLVSAHTQSDVNHYTCTCTCSIVEAHSMYIVDVHVAHVGLCCYSTDHQS